MDEGLAHQMTYGDGSGQNTKHHYAGTIKSKKRKTGPCKVVKTKKKVVKRI